VWLPPVCGSRTSSTAEKYRGSFVKWNHCSWERRTRSVTDSGRPFGFDQMTSARQMRPSWSMHPMAYRHGRPMRDFAWSLTGVK